MMRHFLEVDDLSAAEVARVLDVPAEALASCAAWDRHRAALTRAYWDRRWGAKS